MTAPRPPASEEPPFKRRKTDGMLNPGSYEVGAVVDAITLAHDLYLADRRQYSDTPAPPDERELEVLGVWLLTAADNVQQACAGRRDRMGPSHVQARRAVRTALDAYPVPWGAEPDHRKAWWNLLVAHATTIYRLALAIVEDPDHH